jgi:heptosyltransferase-2
MNRILVIRGGAIGDFILTLPALKALRENFADARLEILGYKHIAALAENRFYAEAVRSIEYAALSGFFARDGKLDQALHDYFAGFDLVVSYLFDPDTIFESNLRRSGVRKILCGPAKMGTAAHAAEQLAEPLGELGIKPKDHAARFFPSKDDRKFADEFLKETSAPIVALHVGSGSIRKNWPIDHWIQFGEELLGQSDSPNPSLLIVSGEADEDQRAILEKHWRDRGVRFATNLPLPSLAAVLAECAFVGHDSGISHLAAAAGAKCILLFGPTDAAVWAPLGGNVRVIRAPSGDLSLLEPAQVLNEMWEGP